MDGIRDAEQGVSGTLYVVPTPIGNLEDMTLRAIRVLKEVDRILAEDTRHTLILCHHFGIATPLTSLNEHNLAERLPEVLARLEGGASMALVSDAGTPGISDPGSPLLEAVLQRGITVRALPGACAVTTALSASGFAAQRFVFEGFLPRKGRDRARRLAEIAGEDRTVAFYESPKRLEETLKDLERVLPPGRLVVISRELSKRHESWYRGDAAALVRQFAGWTPRGEVTVMVAGASRGERPEVEAPAVEVRLKTLFDQGLRVREAASAVARETGLPRGDVYRLALDLRRQGENPDS
ncbi:MAG: 16S rRNA (cytidine(1402)-2'-O)-methyltransferase [Magnetococcales bacterium]|nr:16S rRNA (cytidine(1402)-2'-O)-methyltransferase [Magnetococcales bacterium]